MSVQHFFRINGMHCSGCVETVESAVSVLDDVEDIEIDLETGMASVSGNVSVDKVIEVIDAAGYNAILIAE